MDIEASKFCPMMIFPIRTNAKRKYSDFYQNYFSGTYFDFQAPFRHWIWSKILNFNLENQSLWKTWPWIRTKSPFRAWCGTQLKSSDLKYSSFLPSRNSVPPSGVRNMYARSGLCSFGTFLNFLWDPGTDQRQPLSSVASSSASQNPRRVFFGVVWRNVESWCGGTAEPNFGFERFVTGLVHCLAIDIVTLSYSWV